ncbi:MAG: asparaginase [Actinomycetota bacterium]
MPSIPVARVIRSGVEESVHYGDVAVADADGGVVASCGDPERVVFARSTMKPLQAAVSLSHLPFDPPDAEVAVMSASHNAEPVHLEAVRSLLKRAGVSESALQCPPFRPWDEETAARSSERRRINSDCSGKHAGMLAACAARGWPTETYLDPAHPLQESVLGWVTEVSGQHPVSIGVDGCGVPVHALPLRAVATIYARLGSPERISGLEPQVRRVVAGMRGAPYHVAGRNRVDTAVMESVPGVVVKSGAEALICGGVLDRGLGVAVKVRDGGARAAGPALIRVMEALGLFRGHPAVVLEPFRRPPVLGGGEPVGQIVAEFDVTPARPLR